MANNSNDRTSLKGRVAAEKMANVKKVAQQKTAAAWTIAKTMLPNAPQAEQEKFASTLMANSATTLKVALRQTAVNAHWSRVAEQFASVHKVDMNDLLENPSILNKEENAVAAELKGDAKNASTKVADDRKDAGPLPAEYPEPKRDEPSELDGSNAAKGRPESWTEGPGKDEGVSKNASDKKDEEKKEGKEASAKTACGESCEGNCEHKKEAAAKTAEEEVAKAEGEKAADEAAAEGAEAAAEGAEEVAEGEEAEEHEEGAEAAEVDADAAEATGEGEEFDPAKANLEEAAADLEHDIDQLQDAIAELGEEPSDITFEGEEGAEGAEGGTDTEIADMFGDAGEGAEVPAEDGEELNFDNIFDENNMADKVSSLNDEDAELGELVAELNGDEDFFGPSDPAELEAVLEQEETIDDPHALFAIEASSDPMAALFGKTATETDVIKPGEIVKALDTDLAGGEGRDAETDHEGTIFEEVFNSLKQPTRDDHRQGETKPNLKEPAKQAGIRKLRPQANKRASASAPSNANLASLLFTDEADYL